MYVFMQEAKLTRAPDATKALGLVCWTRLKIISTEIKLFWYYKYSQLNVGNTSSNIGFTIPLQVCNN